MPSAKFSRFVSKAASAALIASVLMTALPTATALARGKPVSNSGATTLSIRLLDSTDGLAHYGQRVTFDVSTTATDKPFVDLNCYQNSQLVYSHSAGFYASYPWPSAQTFTLSSTSWTGGAANCTATAYYSDGRGGFKNLATLSVAVSA